MKASELIEKLQVMVDDYDDFNVLIYDWNSRERRTIEHVELGEGSVFCDDECPYSNTIEIC